jgi:subtilisin family serine protease
MERTAMTAETYLILRVPRTRREESFDDLAPQAFAVTRGTRDGGGTLGGDSPAPAAYRIESRRDQQADYRIAVAPPAAADGVLSVGALGTAGAPHDRLSIAAFSNCRPQVCAPGVGVLSAQVGGGLVRLSGTSMASPHVAGLAALWAEREERQSGAVRIATISERVRGRAGRERLEPGADVADVGGGLASAPQD